MQDPEWWTTNLTNISSSDSKDTESDKDPEDDGEMDPLNLLFVSLIDNESSKPNISTDHTHIPMLGQDDPDITEIPGPQNSQPAPVEPPSAKRTCATLAKYYNFLSSFLLASHANILTRKISAGSRRRRKQEEEYHVYLNFKFS